MAEGGRGRRRFSARLTDASSEGSSAAGAETVIGSLGLRLAAAASDVGEGEDEEEDVVVWRVAARMWQLGFAGDESPCWTVSAAPGDGDDAGVPSLLGEVEEEERGDVEASVRRAWGRFLREQLPSEVWAAGRCPPFAVVCGCFGSAAAAARVATLCKEVVGFRNVAVVDARLAAVYAHGATTLFSVDLDDADDGMFDARFLAVYEGYKVADGAVRLSKTDSPEERARTVRAALESTPLAIDLRKPLLGRGVYLVGPAAGRALGDAAPVLSESGSMIERFVFPPHAKYASWIGLSKGLCNLHALLDALRGSVAADGPPPGLLVDGKCSTASFCPGLEEQNPASSASSSLAEDVVPVAPGEEDVFLPEASHDADRDELVGIALAKLGQPPPSVSFLERPAPSGPIWLPFWPKPRSGSGLSVLENGAAAFSDGGRGIWCDTKHAVQQESPRKEKEVPQPVTTEETQKTAKGARPAAERTTRVELVTGADAPATRAEVEAAIAAHPDDLRAAVAACKDGRVFSCALIRFVLEATPSVKTRLDVVSVLGQRCTDPQASKPIVDLFKFNKDKQAAQQVFKDRAKAMQSKAVSGSKRLAAGESRGRGGRGGRGRGRGGRGGRGAKNTAAKQASPASKVPTPEPRDTPAPTAPVVDAAALAPKASAPASTPSPRSVAPVQIVREDKFAPARRSSVVVSPMPRSSPRSSQPSELPIVEERSLEVDTAESSGASATGLLPETPVKRLSRAGPRDSSSRKSADMSAYEVFESYYVEPLRLPVAIEDATAAGQASPSDDPYLQVELDHAKDTPSKLVHLDPVEGVSINLDIDITSSHGDPDGGGDARPDSSQDDDDDDDDQAVPPLATLLGSHIMACLAPRHDKERDETESPSDAQAVDDDQAVPPHLTRH